MELIDHAKMAIKDKRGHFFEVQTSLFSSLITTIESQKEEIDKLRKDNQFLTIVNDRFIKSSMAKNPPYYNNQGVYCSGDGTPIPQEGKVNE